MTRTLRTIAPILLAASIALADGPEPDFVGVTVDESGRGIAGATVRATIWGRAIEARSDASGSFRMALPPDPGAGGRFWTTLLAEDEGGRLGRLSVIRAGTEGEPPKVVLKPARELAVVAVDDRGGAVGEADVDFLDGMRPLAHGRTDAEGRWVARVPADATDWAVLARKGGVGMDYASAERARGSTEKPFPLPARIELKLDGVKPLRVKVVDREGRPIAGANVGPWLIAKPGHEADLNLGGMLPSWPATGPDGVATLDWLPVEGPNRRRSILTRAEGFYSPDHATWIKPDDPAGEVSITLLPLERLSGRVTDAEGRPAAGVVVGLQGQGGGDNGFRGTARTDPDGRYQAKVASEQAYIITATRDDLAAPYRSDVVVRAGRPSEGVDLVLGRATRIRGRVAVGKDERPVPKAQVTLSIRKGSIPKELARPGDRVYRELAQQSWTTADDSGRYEFTVGPGEYLVLGPARVEPAKVEIPASNPPAEVVVDLTMPRAETGPFAATVVDPEGHPVAGAVVDGRYASFQARRWFERARTDDRGSIRTERSLDPLVLHARTLDGKLAGVARSDSEATEARVVLSPVATATGTLLDGDGRPVPRRKLDYGIRIPMGPEKNSPWSDAFGGTATTDDLGRFTLPGLVPGQAYHLNLPTGDDGSSRGVTEFTAPGPGPFALGEVSVDTRPYQPYVPPTAKERTAEAFAARATTSPKERLAAMLPEARREYTRPLLLFGKKDDPACVELFRLFNEPTPEADEPPTPAGLRWEFELMSLDLARPDALAFGRELGVDLGEGSPPTLVVLDGDGRVAASRPLRLDESRKLDGPALARFLLDHKPATRDAEKMLADAQARARAEDKRVFLIASASWCGPCRMLARFLDARKTDLDAHYVFVKLDVSRDLHATAVRDRYPGAAGGGVPWYAILDGDGKPLATSDMPDRSAESGASNIGFPSARPAVDHFVGMLRRTAPRLAGDQVDELRKALLKK